MESNVLAAIQGLLNQSGTAYRLVHHEPTFTSEESARARGEDVRIGGKALLLKLDDLYRLFVLSAALQLDSAAIRSHFGTRKVRFATRDELAELAALVPGAVPPFGRPILPFDLYVDPSIQANERIAFNAGSLTDSIIMSVADYLCVAQPNVFAFARAADSTAPAERSPS
jgi:Ala-tRNA(Pro) deacylase